MNKSYNDVGALPNVINYVLDSSLYGGVSVDPEHAVEQMMLVKQLWHKTAGRQVRHFFLSFACIHFYYSNILSAFFNLSF